jgi:hypothetical protein
VIQRAPGLTIDPIVVPRRAGAHTPNGISLYARWLLSRMFGVAQSEGSEPSRVRKLRPYERSRCAEHGGSCTCAWERSVPAPPEVDMVAPQMLVRNASMVQT